MRRRNVFLKLRNVIMSLLSQFSGGLRDVGGGGGKGEGGGGVNCRI